MEDIKEKVMAITKEEEDALKKKWEDDYNRKLLLQTPIKTSTSKTPYIVLLIVMAALVMASIVLLEVFSIAGKDNTTTIGLILGFGATLTTGILTYIRAEKAENQSLETHILVNSRLSALMTEAKAASHAEGEMVGRDIANARSDELAKRNIQN